MQNLGTVLIGEALFDCFADAHVPGGAPFNVARSLAAMIQLSSDSLAASAPTLITRVGTDANGKSLVQEARRCGVGASGFQFDAQLATGTVAIRMQGSAHEFHIAENCAWDAIDPAASIATAQQCRPSALYFGSLAQRGAKSRHAVAQLLEFAEQIGAVRYFDVNLRQSPSDIAWRDIIEFSLQRADIVKVNEDELQQLFTWFTPGGFNAAAALSFNDPAFKSALCKLLAQFKFQALIVTRGALGYVAFDGSGLALAQGYAPSAVVVDTVGAGDAFTSALIFGHLQGWPLARTLACGNELAAAICTIRGAIPADLSFYQPYLQSWSSMTCHSATAIT
jgi:fructokinase